MADIVGYTDPDHTFGPDSQLRAVMTGRAGNGDCPGTLRRLILDPGSDTAIEETVAETGHEFPYLHPDRRTRRHRYGYFATVRPGEGILPSGLARIDTDSGSRQSFEFEHGQYCIEPVFAPNPKPNGSAGDRAEPGWLMTVVNDGTVDRAHLAVFNAEHLDDGPLARVHLEHTTPFSFHGTWTSQR